MLLSNKDLYELKKANKKFKVSVSENTDTPDVPEAPKNKINGTRFDWFKGSFNGLTDAIRACANLFRASQEQSDKSADKRTTAALKELSAIKEAIAGIEMNNKSKASEWVFEVDDIERDNFGRIRTMKITAKAQG